MGNNPPRPDPLVIRDTAAAALAGISRATWHRLRAGDKIPAPIKLGRAVRWRKSDIELWILLGCPARPMFEAAKAAHKARESRGVNVRDSLL